MTKFIIVSWKKFTVFTACVLIVFISLLGGVLVAGTNKFTVSAELIQAAHKVLDLGYDCSLSGASRDACHAQLTTAIKERLKK